MKNTKNKILTITIFIYVVTVIVTACFSYASFYSRTVLKSKAKIGAFVIDIYQNSNQTNSLVLNSSYDKSNEITYQFSVTNAISSKCSEVNTKYDIIITLQNKLPNNVSFTLNNKTGSVSPDGLKYTFTNMGTFNAGIANTHIYTLKFNVKDIALIWDDITISPIDISVIAEQIN